MLLEYLKVNKILSMIIFLEVAWYQSFEAARG